MSEPTRVFVSYVRENLATVARLVAELRLRGAEVWFDQDTLPAGVVWRDEIRRAVSRREYFLACFSLEQNLRQRTYMNEELELAIQEIRLRGDVPWFIPILLSGDIPDITIGATRTLRDLQYVVLNDDSWSDGIDAIARSIGLTYPTKPPPRRNRAWFPIVTAIVGTVALVMVANRVLRPPLEPRANVESAILMPDGMRSETNNAPLLIAPEPDSKDFLLMPALAEQSDFELYRLEIVEGASDRAIWSRDGLRLNADGVFTILVPGSYLHPGPYRLIVKGLHANGNVSDIAMYTLRVANESSDSRSSQ